VLGLGSGTATGAMQVGGLLVLAVACVAVSVLTFRSYSKNV